MSRLALDSLVALDRLRNAVDALLCGQEAAKTGCLLALLARQHVLLEGPPGCGKSVLAKGLATVSGARVVHVALHRETRASDLLGPAVLVRSAAATGERLALARGRSPLHEAELLVLDDLPRAPGQVLQPLLRVLSERRPEASTLERRPGASTLRLECAVATATPVGPGSAADPLEPAALDHFGVQVLLHGLLSGGRWAQARPLLDAEAGLAPAPVIDTGLRHGLQARAAALEISAPVREELVGLAERLAGLRAPDGAVLVSDRSLARVAPPLLRAHALLRGAGCVERADLAAVRFMLGRRVPESLLPLAEELVADAARAARAPATSASGASPQGGEAGAGDTRGQETLPGSGAHAPPPAPRVSAPAPADVAALLRALEGRLEPGLVDRGLDPGGAPRRQARLARLDELDDADAVEALLFVDGSLPGTPRVLRRERRRAGGGLAVLRDVSASMEGGLGRAASQVVAGLVRLAARARMRVGYLEFHHEAEPFESDGAFFHRRYGRLLALAARERAEGRTSYEAPLRVALAAFAGAPRGSRHAVLLTDGVPVVGDPWVVRERGLARRLGVRIHTVFMGSGEPPAVLERLARETGGRCFVLEGASSGRLRVRERGAA